MPADSQLVPFVTEADRERLLKAQEHYRNGVSLAEIEKKFEFGESELTALTTTQAWREVALEREEMRRSRLMDRVMDMGNKTLEVSQRVGRRIDDAAREPQTPESLKDLSSALKDLSSAAKNTAESVGAIRESAALSMQGNVINTLNVIGRPAPQPRAPAQEVEP